MRTSALFAPLFLLPLACSSVDSMDSAEDELTSVTARSRTLEFEAYVYVRDGASDSEILQAVRSQTQSAFGALRTSEIGVNSRELKDVDPKTFVKTPVTVVDPTNAAAPVTKMSKVKYRYTDNAVVPVSMSRRSVLPSAVLSPGYMAQKDRILKECTANDADARDFASSLWYVFEPTVRACSTAMAEEQKAIDADAATLNAKAGEIPKSEATRLYLPTTVKLGADKTNKGKSYPEYDRLFAGGVEKGKLVISMVSGFIDHGPMDETDSGFGEWLEQLRGATSSQAGWTVAKTEPSVDLANFEINGKKISGVSFADLEGVFLDETLPSGLSRSDAAAFKKEVGARLIKHWITLETKVQVSVGGKAPEPLTIQIVTYFGASSSSEPHKRAIKNSDVYIYNGHSYIGYGPLDPRNFTSADFPSSYQLLFIDGCVSYNYYEKDYIPLKSGGTANLDLITNGLEAPASQSGYALGQFVKLLIDGTQHSYLDLLEAAEATDSLRVVDGELDNLYSPDKMPIAFK